ncbi:hypothetical protein ACP70R_005259 [Stipagrostis hirtigluma subsp. patula]
MAGAGGEHHVRLPPPAHGRGLGRVVAATAPEQRLSCFVRAVALIERLGNALGALAFTWATVVLLGGYPTVLQQDDFTCLTILVFLETGRMLGRNNRPDYQLFFYTRGAVRPLGWSGLIVVVWLSNIMALLSLCLCAVGGTGWISKLITALIITVPILTAAVGQFISPRALKLVSKPVRRALSLGGPLVAVLLMVPVIFMSIPKNRNIVATWILFVLLFLAVLMLTLSRIHCPPVAKLLDIALGSQKVFKRRLLMSMCMLAELLLLALMSDDPFYRISMIPYQACALVSVSLGNLQISMAALRLMLAWRLVIRHDYYGDNANDPAKANLGKSLDVFYGMVLGQGALYLVVCTLKILSFIPRRSLVRRGVFRGQTGVESVNSYYGYAMEKCMDRNVLAGMNISLWSFAVDSLDSDSSMLQLHGIQTMHCLLLQMEPIRTQLLAKLAASTKTVATLLNMLEWTSPSRATLLAAMVIAELAKSHRVINIPRTVKAASALLDSGSQQRRGSPLLNIEDQVHGLVSDNKSGILDSATLNTKLGGSWMLIWWRRISGFWAIIPEPEEPPEDQDVLPVLAMSILDSLASGDQDSCEEISRTNGLISRIIGFASNCKGGVPIYTDAQQKILVRSSLQLLQRLTDVSGEIGVTLRHKVSRHPFLLRSLSEILRGSTSGEELSILVAATLRNLAIDRNTRQSIGRKQIIISSLMQAFLSPDVDRLQRKVSGQALAILAMDNVGNCLTMLRGTECMFIGDLARMIHEDWYRCVAASLLRSMCQHARHQLKDSELRELAYALREVLDQTMEAEGAELDILVGLSSQMSKVIPGHFAQELEVGGLKGPFMKRLVDALNANIERSASCPGIRRTILEQAINLMECDSGYTSWLNDCGLAEALWMVEETASEAEDYGLLMGDAGLMEATEPLASLVARAKQLLATDSTKL